MSQSAEILKVSSWQQRFADWLIANPDKPLSEASKEFGRSVPWLSTVRNSDAFQDYFKKLSAAHSEAVSHTVREKTLGLADQVISKLQERVAIEGDLLPVKALVEIGDMALKRTGHGESGGASPGHVTVNLGVVDASVLQAARERMRLRSTPLLEAEVSPGVGDGTSVELLAHGGS